MQPPPKVFGLCSAFRNISNRADGNISATEDKFKQFTPLDHMRDDLYRFETDLFVTPAIAKMIRRWKPVLKRRFEQREVYVRISDGVTRL